MILTVRVYHSLQQHQCYVSKNSWLCFFWNFLYPSKAISRHYFPKKLKSCILKNLGGLRGLGESKRRYYMTMGQYDPELIIRPDKVQYWAKTVYLMSKEWMWVDLHSYWPKEYIWCKFREYSLKASFVPILAKSGSISGQKTTLNVKSYKFELTFINIG